jgi:hypothetical protein
VALRGVQVDHFNENLKGHTSSEQFGAAMANLQCQFDCVQTIFQRLMQFVDVFAREPHHSEISHLNTAKPILATKFDTSTKMLICGDHAPTLVIGIAKSAQGTHFSFHRARIAGILQCKLVLLKAAIDQGLKPHTISTDIHNPPPGRTEVPPYSHLTTTAICGPGASTAAQAAAPPRPAAAGAGQGSGPPAHAASKGKSAGNGGGKGQGNANNQGKGKGKGQGKGR